MKIYKQNNRWHIRIGKRTVSSPQLCRVLKIVTFGCFIIVFTSCSAASVQKFKELNTGPTSTRYKDTVINGTFVRIPIPKPPKTDEQKRKDRQALAITVGIAIVWYVGWQEFGN